MKCRCKIVDSIPRNRANSTLIRTRCLRATTANNNQYIQLTARQSEIDFMKVFGHEMVSIPLTARHRTDRRRWKTEHRGWMQSDL